MDEDDYLGPGGGSGLASIFGASVAMDGSHGNESLTYKAPKQPKKQKGSGSGQESQQVLAAVSVDCQKHVDGHYQPQGKLGCALIG
uniref:Uncharacterized protein n=1 Tax=Amphimedon queenslandica TaxID=400682 RepID=A0A1X7TB59_AMPQE